MNSSKSIKTNLIKNFPSQCGVYLMKDIKNHVIYVGKAKNLKSRVQSYFVKDTNFKNMFLVPKIHQIDYILTDTEIEAYLLEANLVKKHKPRYNIRLKDDKSYPYIRCSMDEPFPRFYVERKVKKKGSLYFGPYTDAFFVRSMIRFLNQQFKIRDCSTHFMKNREKPCLTYHIGNCTAPCVKQIDYSQQIKGAVSFLKGRGTAFLKQMEKQMKELSKQQRFEEATQLRDRIKAVKFCREKQLVVSSQKKNLDIVSFYRDKKAVLFHILHIRSGLIVGNRFHYENNVPSQKTFFLEHFFSFIIQYYKDNLIPDLVLLPCAPSKDFLFSTLEQVLFKLHEKSVRVRVPKNNIEKSLMQMSLKNAQSRFKQQDLQKQSMLEGLADIQKVFKLNTLPERIECFDVSHFQGENQVASQVVFEEGIPKKSDYRKYKIKVQGIDDFASIKEVVLRRFKHKEYPDPNLVIVDGGKGQLSKAVLALKEVNRSDIPLVAIAKAKVKSNFSATQVQKSEERFFIPGRKNPLIFSANSQALHILTHLRDEAHRFAITFHRELSQKSFIK